MASYDKQLLKARLAKVPATPENGIRWYQWLFTQHPEWRNYFVGAANVQVADLPKSERFQKQGVRFLNQMNRLVDKADNASELDEEVKPFVEKHIRYKVVSKPMYQEAGGVWLGYLRTFGEVPADEEAEWLKLWNAFVEILDQKFIAAGQNTA